MLKSSRFKEFPKLNAQYNSWWYQTSYLWPHQQAACLNKFRLPNVYAVFLLPRCWTWRFCKTSMSCSATYSTHNTCCVSLEHIGLYLCTNPVMCCIHMSECDKIIISIVHSYLHQTLSRCNKVRVYTSTDWVKYFCTVYTEVARCWGGGFQEFWMVRKFRWWGILDSDVQIIMGFSLG